MIFTNPNASLSDDRDQINTERLVSGFRQKVGEHWRHGNGACDGCPIRCENQGFDPLFGLFNYDADLMIVAREPGTFNEFSESGNGKGRVYRTMPPEEEVKDHPHLVERRGYDYKAASEWNNLLQAAMRLFDSEKYTNRETGSPTVGCSLEDAYFTNALKCSKLADDVRDVDNPKERNKVAREQCRTYLKEEIELVSPQIIVTFGGNAWTDTIRALELENAVEHISTLSHNINSNNEFGFDAFGSDPVVIPSYHWSNLGRQKSNIDFIADGDQAQMYDRYFSELARRIKRELK